MKKLRINIWVVIVFVSLATASFASEQVNSAPHTTTIYLKGLSTHADNPLLLDFIIYRPDSAMTPADIKSQGEPLVKYFLTSLTLPDEDAWVNLSPLEKDRIIPDALGSTEMGQTMLEQDYQLKQMAASLTNPATELGKRYWDALGGQTSVMANLAGKVWITSGRATVVEKDGLAYITETRLKVLMAEDFLKGARNDSVSSDVFRRIILPELEREVNEGPAFAPIRQVYHSVILATWYKKALKASLLSRVYADKAKVAGIDTADRGFKTQIYEQYLKALRDGAYKMIQEEKDEGSEELIPRKYFSGGVTQFGKNINIQTSSAAVAQMNQLLALDHQQGHALVLNVRLDEAEQKSTLMGEPVTASSPNRDEILAAGFSFEVSILQGSTAVNRTVRVTQGIKRYYKTPQKVQELAQQARALIEYIERYNPGVVIQNIYFSGPRPSSFGNVVQLDPTNAATLIVPSAKLDDVLLVLQSELDTKPLWVLGGGLKGPEFNNAMTSQQGWQDLLKIYPELNLDLKKQPIYGIISVDLKSFAQALKIDDLNRVRTALYYFGFSRNDDPEGTLFVFRNNYSQWQNYLIRVGRLNQRGQLLPIQPEALKMAEVIIQSANPTANSQNRFAFLESAMTQHWMAENDKLTRGGGTIVEFEALKNALAYLGLFYTSQQERNDEPDHLTLRDEVGGGIFSFWGGKRTFDDYQVKRVATTDSASSAILSELHPPRAMDKETWRQILVQFKERLGLPIKTSLGTIEAFLRQHIIHYDDIALLYTVKLKPDAGLTRVARTQAHKPTRVNPQVAMNQLAAEYISMFKLQGLAETYFSSTKSSSAIVGVINRKLENLQSQQQEHLQLLEEMRDQPQGDKIQNLDSLTSRLSDQVSDFNVVSHYLIEENPELMDGDFSRAVDQLTIVMGQIISHPGAIEPIEQLGRSIENIRVSLEQQVDNINIREDHYLQELAEGLYWHISQDVKFVEAFQSFVKDYLERRYGYAYERVYTQLTEEKVIGKNLQNVLRELYKNVVSTYFTHQRFLIILGKVSDMITEKSSSAMIEKPSEVVGLARPVGGIDLNPSRLNLQIKRDQKGVPLPLSRQDIEHMNIQGFYPVITGVQQTIPGLAQPAR